MTEEKKECAEMIKVKSVYQTVYEGKYIHRSLDAKNRFSEIFRTVFRDEKDSIIEKKAEIFMKSIKVLDKKQKVELLIAWEISSLSQEAKELVALEQDDPSYMEEFNKQLEIIKKRKRGEFNKLEPKDLEGQLIEEGKTQVSLGPAMEAAYKYLISETFRDSNDLTKRIFASPAAVGENLTDIEFNKLIALRTEFENMSVGDEALKK